MVGHVAPETCSQPLHRHGHGLEPDARRADPGAGAAGQSGVTIRPGSTAFRVCPVHEYPGDCWDACLPERVELTNLAAELRKYWHDRKNGVAARRPMPFAEVELASA